MSEAGQAAGGQGQDPRSWTKPGCVTLRCRADGPLVVELPAADGDDPGFRVIDHVGAEFELPAGKRAVALCRCGHSSNRPFCDGSHRAAGFTAQETARRP